MKSICHVNMLQCFLCSSTDFTQNCAINENKIKEPVLRNADKVSRRHSLRKGTTELRERIRLPTRLIGSAQA
jgi:hypothetical protein